MADGSTPENSAYRRGTVLGLTVAEVFILLLFLVLIALLALVRDWEVERSAARDESEVLQAWRGVLEEFKEPEEIATLRLQKEAAERASERHRERAEALQEVIEKSKTSGMAEAVEEALAQAESARQAARQAKHELHMLRTKGINPPCWYRTVPTEDGATREKAHYTFKIAVFDEHMVVLREATPPGGAADDSDDSFAIEAGRLKLDALPYGQPLSNRAFREHFAAVRDAGQSAQVRTYPCIFFVRVWDRTSPSAKNRWQRANDETIESLFGTYRVKDDPWPGEGTSIARM